jgi:hypothetical protein
MNTELEQIVANAIENGEDNETVELIKSQYKKNQEDAEEGKLTGVATTDATATSKNVASSDTELVSGDSSLESQSDDEKEVPEYIVEIKNEDGSISEYSFEQINSLLGTVDPISGKKYPDNMNDFINRHKGRARIKYNNILDEVDVGPGTEIGSVVERVDELAEEFDVDLFKIHPGYSINKLREIEGAWKYNNVEPSSTEKYLIENLNNPLTGIEEIRDGYNVLGVKRVGINANENQTKTSIELKSAAGKIYNQLVEEDKYLTGEFSNKTLLNNGQEFRDWQEKEIANVDWSNPKAWDDFLERSKLKLMGIFERESKLDPEYMRRTTLYTEIVNSKFNGVIANKNLEEQKSELIPDWAEGNNVLEGLHQLFAYELPKYRHNIGILERGEKLNNIRKLFNKNYKDTDKGYIGVDNKGEPVFKTGPFATAGMVDAKKTTWGEAKNTLIERGNDLGFEIMKDLVESQGYQDKISVLGTPEIFDENFKWSLDGDDYKKLFGTQMGQMFIATMSLGMTTYMQEAGGMLEEAVYQQAAMMYDNSLFVDKMQGEGRTYTKEDEDRIMEQFYKLDQDKRNELCVKVLADGLIDFDSIHAGGARAAGLDMIGNFFVLGKATKVLPKSVVNSWMNKNAKDFFRSLKPGVKAVGAGTLVEYITETLQAVNSELTVMYNSPLKTFDYHRVINEGAMGAIVPGPIIASSMTFNAVVQEVNRNAEAAKNPDYVRNWLREAESQLQTMRNNKDIDFDTYDKAMQHIQETEDILLDTKLKDVQNIESRQSIIQSLSRAKEGENKIADLNAEIAKIKEQYPTSGRIKSIEQEIANEQEKIKRETDNVIVERAVDHWLQNSAAQAHWQNSNNEGVYKNRSTIVFETVEEAEQYLIDNNLLNEETQRLLDGKSHGINVGISGTDMVINMAISENVIKAIRGGTAEGLMAGNVINHEQGHDNLATFNEKELADLRVQITKELALSEDPQMQRVFDLVNIKLNEYKKQRKKGVKIDERTMHEEFFTAISDAFHVVNMESLSTEGNTTMSFLGSLFAGSFEKNIGPIVDWKEGFDSQGVLEFLKSYTQNERIDFDYTKTYYVDKNGNKVQFEDEMVNLFDEGVEKGQQGVFVKDSKRVYPPGRTSEEIKLSNEVLQKELREEKKKGETKPGAYDGGDPNVIRELQGELTANNMGTITLFTLPMDQGGLYFDSNGSVSYDMFYGEVMFEVAQLLDTYKPHMGNFNTYLRTNMNKRIPGVWDRLTNDQFQQYTVPIHETNIADEYFDEESSFGTGTFDEEIILSDGTSTTKSIEVSKMRKLLDIKDDDPVFNEILDVMTIISAENIDAIHEDGFRQDTKDRAVKELFKTIKGLLGTPGSKKYKSWLEDNIEMLYNLIPQSDFNVSYDEFNDIISARANTAQSESKELQIKTGVIVKNKAAGNRVAVKKPFTKEIGEQFIQALLNPKKGRPASKQDALINQISSVIAFDAMAQVTSSDQFIEAHGLQQSIISTIADKINRDMTVKFSHSVKGTKYSLSTPKELQQAGLLITAVETSGLTEYSDVEDFVNDLAVAKGMGTNVADFVTSLAGEDLIEMGDAIQYKSDLVKYLDKVNPKLANQLRKDGSIKGKKVVLDKLYDDMEKVVLSLDPELASVLSATDFEMFGFHRRVLDPAATKQGPARIITDTDGKIIKAGKRNLSYKKRGKGAYINSLLIQGWTFDPSSNMFISEDGKKKSKDPVRQFDAVPVRGDYYERLQSLKEQVQAKVDDPNYVPTGKWDDVRPMNLKISGGLFKRINSIVNNKKLNRDEKLAKLEKLAPEIELANKANIELAINISKEIAEAVKNGDINETSLVHMLQSQTNLAAGFRALTKLELISVLEGNYKAMGEHMTPNSKTMFELTQAILNYKNDPNFNLDLALTEIFQKHSQVFYSKEEGDIIDTDPRLKGRTDPSAWQRLKVLSKDQLENMVSFKGETYMEAMARIEAVNNIELETAKKKFELERQNKKEDAIQNINLKNTTEGVSQGGTVVDFDETVIVGGKNVVYATHPKTGEKITIKSEDFVESSQQLLDAGFEFDFSDYINVKGGKRGPFFAKLKSLYDKYGSEAIYVLTARQPESATAIQMWLEQNGINLPLENINGLGVMGPDGKPILVTGKHKADWIEQNLIWNGYNDILFADDALANVTAVQNMFDEYPPGVLHKGGKAVLVKESLNTQFNQILESTTGVGAQKTYSEAQGKIQGAKINSVWDFVYPPSAYDFEMFTYRYTGKGTVGEKQAEFFKENLFMPYEEAISKIDEKKQQIRNDYKNLLNELPQVKANLKETIPGTNYTTEQAIRVYLWSKNGIKIPGISKRDQAALVKTVSESKELMVFADRLSVISQQKEGYIIPSEYWTVEGIAYDLTEMTGKVGRANLLKQWKLNVEEIFSEENKNKLRSIYGNAHVEALEDMLYRMEYGRNRTGPGRIEATWNNWVNNSVGAIMFFNMRSATLQTISAANYIDWQDNNIINAATAFANQKQYWKDFGYIFNSSYLKERRAGSRRTINEAELAAHVAGKENKAKAAIAWLLEKGFLPTQIADSFAISSGGAAYYRNKVNAYLKQGLSKKDAEKQAWIDFRDRTEKGQQSARADLISQQQAGGLGRLILAFKNTPMQYNRLMIKAALDLKNNRGSTKENLSKIAYYGAVQNVIFTSLQTALFSALGDEDEWDNKKERVANGMIDSILNGMGLTGAVAATVKNGYLRYSREKKKGFKADHTRTIIEFANLSPTIGSKLRKLYGAIKTEQMNQGVIEEMGFTLENPAFNSLANLISATTNIPLDRAVQKAQNLILASKSETEVWDKVALTLGWNPWDIGIESTARIVQKEVKKEKDAEKKIIKKQEQEVKDEDQTNILIKQEKQQDKFRTDKQKSDKTYTCPNINNGVRCGNIVDKAGQRCTVHQKVEQRIDGKEVKCKGVRTNGQPCNMMTTAKSGYCVYHD